MRLSLYAVVGVVIIFAMAYGSRSPVLTNAPASGIAQMATQGAYRDGFYLGRLHRKQGIPSRIARGRWSRESDRQLFEIGYNRGYSGSQE